ncbi:MAG TPA: hypothetical protein VFV48_02230 [Pseudomonadales bacterium]|nr:hypothetical protein [Pseudomonadales bacterium]
MRVCVDLDGVIAGFRREGQSYADVVPIDGAVEKLLQLKESGHYIIINTARHMKTCNANSGLVNARIAKVTLEWLERHGIPFDEIYFSKPWADVYLDDNAHRFEGWDLIDGTGLSFSSSAEHRLIKRVECD